MASSGVAEASRWDTSCPKQDLAAPTMSLSPFIGFKSLADYETYRSKLVDDPDARENLAHAKKSGCILVEDRSYFYRVGEKER